MAIDLKQYKASTVKSDKRTTGTAGSKGFMDFLNRDIQLFGSALPDKDKEAFYHELEILMGAGVDIKSCLDHIEKEQKKKKDQVLFADIRGRVLNGETLSEAIRKTGKFSPYEYYSLQIGEESGKLLEVFRELAGYFNARIRQRRQVINALSYPAIVMTVAFGAIYFMMQFMVPMFADVFKRFGGDLPPITKMIVDLSAFVRAWGGWLMVGLVGLLIAGYSQRKKDGFRKVLSMVVLRFPVAGLLVKKIYAARFCRSMALLMSANVPMLQALELVRNMIGYYPMEKSLDQIGKEVMEGGTLHEGLGAHDIFPSRLTALVKVAEEVNQLDVIFEH